MKKAPSTPDATVFVDPETVEAVRRMTSTMLTGLETLASTGGRACAEAGGFASRWLWPRLRDATLFVLGGLGRLLASLVRGLWTHRGVLARIGHRGLWWGALAILVLVGRAMLSADGDPELAALAMTYLVAGLSMSVLVLVSAPETRMRVAAFALASGHGSLAALAWVAVASA